MIYCKAYLVLSPIFHCLSTATRIMSWRLLLVKNLPEKLKTKFPAMYSKPPKNWPQTISSLPPFPSTNSMLQIALVSSFFNISFTITCFYSHYGLNLKAEVANWWTLFFMAHKKFFFTLSQRWKLVAFRINIRMSNGSWEAIRFDNMGPLLLYGSNPPELHCQLPPPQGTWAAFKKTSQPYKYTMKRSD